jgi:UDP-N-acetylmuramate dehydrogenase
MFQRNVFLHQHSNYKIGGPAAYFSEPENIKETVKVLKAWQKIAKNLPVKERQVFVLGGGTNILFSDDGFSGLILKPKLTYIKRKGNHITAGAGISMADLLKFAIKNSLGGLEWSGGLPGTLGGAVRGNAGCFGGETKDVITKIKSLNFEGKTPKVITRTNIKCRFGYRDSIFKYNTEVILEATMVFEKADKKILAKVAEEKRAYRKSRHPIEYPNIGSIFKNVDLKKVPKSVHKKVAHVIKTDPFPVVPAAYLIAETGVKGVSIGGAMISPKHPNFIVNVSGAKAEEVKKLIELVKKAVYKKFKIRLEEEVMYL